MNFLLFVGEFRSTSEKGVGLSMSGSSVIGREKLRKMLDKSTIADQWSRLAY